MPASTRLPDELNAWTTRPTGGSSGRLKAPASSALTPISSPPTRSRTASPGRKPDPRTSPYPRTS